MKLEQKAAYLICASLVILFSILSTDVKASALPVNEIYHIAADFSVAAYKNQKMVESLRSQGWDVKAYSFKLNLMQIKQQIENNPNFVFMKGLRTTQELLYESAAEYNDYLNTNSMHFPDTEKSFLSLNNINNMSTMLKTADPLIDQHFGYAVGKKTIDNRNVYVISFRGTSDKWSWIFSDFLAVPLKFLDTNTYVHTGFEWNRQACMNSSLLNNFVKEIKTDQSNPCVIITGHSLGAAVAVLESAFLVEKQYVKPENLYLIPLAEPCPGRSDFVDYFKHKLKNYTWFCNKLDPVPYLPLSVGYRHFGKKISFNKPPSDLWERFEVFKWHDILLYYKYIKGRR